MHKRSCVQSFYSSPAPTPHGNNLPIHSHILTPSCMKSLGYIHPLSKLHELSVSIFGCVLDNELMMNSIHTKQAAEDDVIPLSEPLRTASGVVDRVHIAKDQLVQVRIDCMNNAISVWGPDAREFRPERWLDIDGLPSKAKEVQGHKHLLTFVDGTRMCLGRNFALAEFKVCTSRQISLV